MISLYVQIKTIIFSLLYGVVLYFFLEFNLKFLKRYSKIYQFIILFLFIICNSLAYFIILQKINYGIVNVKFLLCILSGYLLSNFVSNKLIEKKKK